MGNRDFRRKEAKKPKKDAKKLPTPDIMPPMPAEVEVIRKKGKKQEEGEYTRLPTAFKCNLSLVLLSSPATSDFIW